MKEPLNREAWANLGAVCQQLNEHSAAIQAYESALQLYLPTLDTSSEGDDKDTNRMIVSTLYENMGRAMLSLGGESAPPVRAIRTFCWLFTSLHHNPMTLSHITLSLVKANAWHHR